MLVNGQRRECWVHLWKLHPGTDVSEVLVPPLIFINMSSQMGINNTNVSVMEAETDRHPSFVTLQIVQENISMAY